MLVSKESDSNRGEPTFLSASPVSDTKTAFVLSDKDGLKWRRVQDSNLCTGIPGDGLAIRCITTLPTLRCQGLYLT